MQRVLETVFEHEDGRDTFTVSACEKWSARKIRKLAEAHPEEVKIVAENEDGSLLAHVPLGWVSIRPKRKMSQAQLDQLRQMRQNKNK